MLFDIHRLSLYEPTLPWQRLMVYVSDSEMVGHFRSARNGLAEFFDGSGECDISALVRSNVGKTFASSFQGVVPTTQSRIVFQADQDGPEGLWVRIFSVLPAMPA